MGILFLCMFDGLSQNPYAYDWSTDLKGDVVANRVLVLDIATDSQGNIYSVGDFKGIIDFSSGDDTAILTSSAPENRDGFIKKTDPEGNLIWVKHIAGVNDEWITGITIDKDDNFYITGFFAGNIDLDPSAGVFEEASNTYWDVFAGKYNKDGELIWAESFEGGGINIALDIDLSDDYNLLIVSGGVRNTINFNLNDPTDIIQVNGDRDAFVLALDLSGNYKWAKVFGGSKEDLARTVKITSDAQIIVGGSVKSPVLFEGVQLGNADLESAFLLNLDLDGALVSNMEIEGDGKSRIVDISNVNNETWVLGEFSSSLKIMGEDLLDNPNDPEVDNLFIMYNTTGDWNFKAIASTGSVYGNAITNLGDGSATIAGSFKGLVDFDWSADESYVLDAGSNEHNYMLRVLDSGVFSWATSLMSIDNSEFTAIEYYEQDAFLIAGVYEGVIDLGLNIPTTVLQETNNISSGFELMLKRDNLELICKDTLEIDLDFNGEFTLSTELVDDGSYSFNGGDLQLSLDFYNVDCFTIENNNVVTLTGLDVISGDSEFCLTVIEVNEWIPPTAICQDVEMYIDSYDFIQVDAMEVGEASFDNCTIETMELLDDTFTCSDVGPNQLILTVIDGSGNSSSCSSTLYLIDNVYPVLDCSPLAVSLDENGDVDLESIEVVERVSDNCSVVEYGISFGVDPCDQTTDIFPSQLYAIDASGNENSCEIEVTVTDTQSPSIVCTNQTVVLDELTDEIQLFALEGLFVAEDNCGIADINASVDIITIQDAGELTVEIIAEDSNGNTASCISIIDVVVNIDADDLFFAPNIFSPNNDGRNDRFDLRISNKVASIEYFEVLDRWGGSMYKIKGLDSNIYHEGWDGLFDGRMASEGVYFYRLRLKAYDSNSYDFSGTVYLSK